MKRTEFFTPNVSDTVLRQPCHSDLVKAYVEQKKSRRLKQLAQEQELNNGNSSEENKNDEN